MPVTTCVFDAYGTLFDVAAAARVAADQPGQQKLAEVWPKLAADWRLKQLQYTWLRAVTGDHKSFWDVTEDGLDWAMEASGLDDPVLRETLLALYWELPAYKEVPKMLATLKATGFQTAILSNGSPDMLDGAVDFAGVRDWLDAVLSVEDVGIFKPARVVYDMVGTRFGTTPEQVLFVSSNGWDAAAAAGYGFTTVWVNRAGDPVDRLPARPAHILSDLTTIPDLAQSL
ncbi:MAG: haloacid dehalogenase type II [Silicimonas sp.]|nr:haloacid dehalogenase type II [Silicimonas sp.]NNF92559.1 haloacid dehalogenase type II [Boseongicola sp.]NND18442.1 haloacid dehalogenase type II [Silicimonas sp.]NND20667.1 haloacid dehalogenase type II [Silicimonas sp.]NND43672.1 haloacid dehalogenase type II [Silicimonas sp.]